MPRVLIVPGLRNSGPGHWQTEWQRHLRHVRRIDVADWSTPNLQAWTDAIDRAIDDFAPTHQFLRERHSPQKFSQPKLRFAV